MNEPIVFVRNGRGQICALEDRCCHRGAPRSLGEATEAGIRCGYHGLEFALDGQCILIPGQTYIPRKARVKSYPIVST
jgi:vanillate O-demethylase monooxygenase subunit